MRYTRYNCAQRFLFNHRAMEQSLSKQVLCNILHTKPWKIVRDLRFVCVVRVVQDSRVNHVCVVRVIRDSRVDHVCVVRVVRDWRFVCVVCVVRDSITSASFVSSESRESSTITIVTNVVIIIIININVVVFVVVITMIIHIFNYSKRYLSVASVAKAQLCLRNPSIITSEGLSHYSSPYSYVTLLPILFNKNRAEVAVPGLLRQYQTPRKGNYRQTIFTIVYSSAYSIVFYCDLSLSLSVASIAKAYFCLSNPSIITSKSLSSCMSPLFFVTLLPIYPKPNRAEVAVPRLLRHYLTPRMGNNRRTILKIIYSILKYVITRNIYLTFARNLYKKSEIIQDSLCQSVKNCRLLIANISNLNRDLLQQAGDVELNPGPKGRVLFMLNCRGLIKRVKDQTFNK